MNATQWVSLLCRNPGNTGGVERPTWQSLAGNVLFIRNLAKVKAYLLVIFQSFQVNHLVMTGLSLKVDGAINSRWQNDAAIVIYVLTQQVNPPG
jgi:hypothetical protein